MSWNVDQGGNFKKNSKPSKKKINNDTMMAKYIRLYIWLSRLYWIRSHLKRTHCNRVPCKNVTHYCRCSHFRPPENTRKPLDFWCFQGVWNNIGEKWVYFHIYMPFIFQKAKSELKNHKKNSYVLFSTKNQYLVFC